jgi:hypothetical protein
LSRSARNELLFCRFSDAAQRVYEEARRSHKINLRRICHAEHVLLHPVWHDHSTPLIGVEGWPDNALDMPTPCAFEPCESPIAVDIGPLNESLAE